MSQDPFYDNGRASVQDQAILMCIERIQELENQVQYLQSKTREYLINSIAACSYLHDAALDVYFHLVGVQPWERVHYNSVTSIISNVLPKYVNEATLSDPRIQRMCSMLRSPKPISQLSEKDIVMFAENWTEVSKEYQGENLYAFLQTWSLEELERYWTYRLTWTRWLAPK